MNNFQGFSKDSIKFYEDLTNKNSKEWFADHKSDYEEFVMKPARFFVTDLGERLQAISSEIQAIPKTDKSIFRIYRDIRFTPDKRPFKTHLGILFWEGHRKKLECPGFYLQIDKDKIFIGSGLYMFSTDIRDNFRRAVVDEKKGDELAEIVAILQKQGFQLGGKHYKKVPRGFDKDHKNAEFLLYNGFWAGKEFPIVEEFYSEDFIDWCFEHFLKMFDLHKWMLQIL